MRATQPTIAAAPAATTTSANHRVGQATSFIAISPVCAAKRRADLIVLSQPWRQTSAQYNPRRRDKPDELKAQMVALETSRAFRQMMGSGFYALGRKARKLFLLTSVNKPSVAPTAQLKKYHCERSLP
jgi:hypothetical protein